MLSTLYIPAVTCICSSSMCATRSSEQRCVVCTMRCAVESISIAATPVFQEVIVASCTSVRFERTIFFVLLRSRVVSIVPEFTFIKLPHCNSIFCRKYTSINHPYYLTLYYRHPLLGQ